MKKIFLIQRLTSLHVYNQSPRLSAMEDPLFHELLLAFDPDLKDWLGIFGYHLQSTPKFSNIYISDLLFPLTTSYCWWFYKYKPLGSRRTVIGITSQPVAQDEIDEYMTKYAPSSSYGWWRWEWRWGWSWCPAGLRLAFNAWLDQLSKGEAAPSRPAVSRPPPKDAKPWGLMRRRSVGLWSLQHLGLRLVALPRVQWHHLLNLYAANCARLLWPHVTLVVDDLFFKWFLTHFFLPEGVGSNHMMPGGNMW